MLRTLLLLCVAVLLQCLQSAQMLLLQAMRLQGLMDLTYSCDAHSSTGAGGSSNGLNSGASAAGTTASLASPSPGGIASALNATAGAGTATAGGASTGLVEGMSSSQQQQQQQAVGASNRSLASNGKLVSSQSQGALPPSQSPVRSSPGQLLQPKRLVQRPAGVSTGSEDVLLQACRVLPSSTNTEEAMLAGIQAGSGTCALCRGLV
jgi:hypothetical protein